MRFQLLIASILCMSIVAACGKAPGNPASSQITEQVAKINEENSAKENDENGKARKNSGTESNTRIYEELLAEGAKIEISGLAFAPGKLPANLKGVTFFPRTTSSVIICDSKEKLRILTPNGEVVDGTYAVESGNMQITFKQENKDCTCWYDTTVSGNVVILHLQNREYENKPMPLLVVANL